MIVSWRLFKYRFHSTSTLHTVRVGNLISAVDTTGSIVAERLAVFAVSEMRVWNIRIGEISNEFVTYQGEQDSIGYE